MRRIISDDQRKINEVKHLYKKQRQKKFNYSLDDFEIYDSQWKHKDWKTWMKGCGRYDHTKKLVEQYIAKCNKPYGQRNLSKFHLV